MFSVFQRSGDWRQFYKNAPVTSVIIILNTLFLIVTLVTGGFSPNDLIEIGAIYKPVMTEVSDYWRIITAAFLHGGIIHFLGNMIIGVLTLSSALERLIGSKKFSIIYFGSLIISGLVVVFFSEVNAVTIGASGAIFGVLGSLLYITFYRRDMLSPRDTQSIRSLILINIVFTFLSAGISIWGHVGGILAGFLLSFLVIRRNIFKVLH
ncbi:Rhomboid protease GluP [Candidatus Izimaplasma bacterium HR1]|jgi:rhomboid protease GluP|uniref:rhomboid family intramembrane serine protease n=1 Tax=Candidatus Izimoplasma sp. HR1 TaxID=1541959 RepID=UPI0004F901B8|nr:Rhomboid protease GluP [Candidatus Izimaplasma bacterium HR1]